MRPFWLTTALLMAAACGDPNRPVCDERDLEVGYTDSDLDGFGTGKPIEFCPGFGEGLAATPLDCNDEDPSINPAATESCNAIDDDCDGDIDQGFDNQVYYLDNDEDGFGSPYPAVRACIRPDRHVRNPDDCDDSNADINPDSPEICNDGVDDDCDGLSDDTDPNLLESSRLTYYLDGDADGFGTPFVVFQACAPQSNWVDNGDDCNDNEQGINPGATEVCNNADDDCDNLIDDADDSIDASTQQTLYRDVDGDGFGDPASPQLACFPIAGVTSTNADDCNDTTALISPDRIDVCNNGVDDDCDPTTDEDQVSGDGYYIDTDGDGFGATDTEILSCTPIAGRVTEPDDCNESDTDINPAAEDVCEDGTDQDCSGSDARCRATFDVSNSVSIFGSNDQMRGVVLTATNAELVVDFGIRVSLLDPCTLDYYVWSRPDESAAWSLLATDQVLHEPMFNQFAYSGEIDVVVVPGVQYAYGVGWEGCPTNVSFTTANNQNIAGPFVLGNFAGWIRDLAYSGFNLGYEPPSFLTNPNAVPHMEFGYSTSFNNP